MTIKPTKRDKQLAQNIHTELSSGQSNGYTIAFNSDKEAIKGVEKIEKALEDIGAKYNVGEFWREGSGRVGYRFSVDNLTTKQ